MSRIHSPPQSLCWLVIAALHFSVTCVHTAHAALLNVPSKQFTTIQDAIDAAVPGDEVVVSDGIYTGIGNMNLDFGGKDITVRSVNGPATCTIDISPSGRAFFLHQEESMLARIEGFTITNGIASEGGGIRILNSAATIVNCVFSGNFAAIRGGGIACTTGTIDVQECVFLNNSTTATSLDHRGGGVHLTNSSATLTNCQFQSNRSYIAGGVGDISSDVAVNNCVFLNNEATVPVAGGGGAYASFGGDVIFSGCTMNGNFTSVVQPGGLSIPGGGALNLGGGTFCIIDCVFQNNQSVAGGAIVTPGISGTAEILRCEFENNSAAVIGGAVAITGSSTISQSTFIDNQQVNSGPNLQRGGGAVYHQGNDQTRIIDCLFAQNTAAGLGGAFRAFNLSPIGSVHILNCTFADNHSELAGHSVSFNGPAGSVHNTIMWGDEDIQFAVSSSLSQIVTHSDIRGTVPGTSINNIQSDPLFINPVGGDYRLTAGSPCVDHGSNDLENLPIVDLDNQARIQGCRIDMGAFESAFMDEVDCDLNLISDLCEIDSNSLLDCDNNLVLDSCEIATEDCNANNIADHCEILLGMIEDCNENNIPDDCDITAGRSSDQNKNGIPDECDPDCNGNMIPDDLDLANGTSTDRNGDGIPDECECPADCDGPVPGIAPDGVVDQFDLDRLFVDWGRAAQFCDPNDDGIVDITDLLLMLAEWGRCP